MYAADVYFSIMRRTQIYLPENIYKRLLLLKHAKELSVAEIIRSILEKHLGEEEATVNESLDDLADLDIKGGPKDLSENFSSYLVSK
jgi:predicted CopG family antitoxin